MFPILIAALLVERIGELAVAERNRRWALRQGARETGARHYPAMVAMHALFYVALVCERIFAARSWSAAWPAWLGLLVAAQGARIWAIATLGRFWNTRILTIPGSRPIARGPYRYVRHPNYAVVVIEILAIPMLCGAYWTALVFSVLNAAVLRVRIREEERALAALDPQQAAPLPRFVPALRRLRAEAAAPGAEPPSAAGPRPPTAPRSR
jgi:methyltransferase